MNRSSDGRRGRRVPGRVAPDVRVPAAGATLAYGGGDAGRCGGGRGHVDHGPRRQDAVNGEERGGRGRRGRRGARGRRPGADDALMHECPGRGLGRPAVAEQTARSVLQAVTRDETLLLLLLLLSLMLLLMMMMMVQRRGRVVPRGHRRGAGRVTVRVSGALDHSCSTDGSGAAGPSPGRHLGLELGSVSLFLIYSHFHSNFNQIESGFRDFDEVAW